MLDAKRKVYNVIEFLMAYVYNLHADNKMTCTFKLDHFIDKSRGQLAIHDSANHN